MINSDILWLIMVVPVTISILKKKKNHSTLSDVEQSPFYYNLGFCESEFQTRHNGDALPVSWCLGTQVARLKAKVTDQVEDGVTGRPIHTRVWCQLEPQRDC